MGVRYISEAGNIFSVKASASQGYCFWVTTEDHGLGQEVSGGYPSRDAAQRALDSCAKAQGWIPERYLSITLI